MIVVSAWCRVDGPLTVGGAPLVAGIVSASRRRHGLRLLVYVPNYTSVRARVLKNPEIVLEQLMGERAPDRRRRSPETLVKSVVGPMIVVSWMPLAPHRPRRAIALRRGIAACEMEHCSCLGERWCRVQNLSSAITLQLVRYPPECGP